MSWTLNHWAEGEFDPPFPSERLLKTHCSFYSDFGVSACLAELNCTRPQGGNTPSATDQQHCLQ